MQAESTVDEVVLDVRNLASCRGWSAVESLADCILSHREATPVLVVRGRNVDSVAFERWVMKTMNTPEIAQADMGRIATAPFPALFAEKLVGLFECGRVIDAAEVNLVVEHFLSRPLDSFAIVFINAERLESADELDLMERAIWRVLVSGPPRDWRRQDLAGYRCYFWNAAAPKPFLDARCRRDRAELAALLRRPLDSLDLESLDRERVVRLVDFAGEHMPPTATGPIGQPDPRRQLEIRRAELRRTIRRRLDAEAAGIARQLTTSLLTLEQKLLQCVEGTQPIRELPGRLDRIATRWRSDVEAEFARRAKEIAAEMQHLLIELDTGNAAAAVSLLPVFMLPSAIRPRAFAAFPVRRDRRSSVRQTIRAMIERAIPEMRAGVHRTLADYRNRLTSILLELETPPAPVAGQSDRERLLSCRRRI